jgi:hypothetical protein
MLHAGGAEKMTVIEPNQAIDEGRVTLRRFSTKLKIGLSTLPQFPEGNPQMRDWS